MSDIVRLAARDGALRRNLPLRARLLDGLRAFFRDKGFLEVETPIACASPGVETHLAAFELRGAGLHEPRYLTTSPEFHMKRLVAAGFGRVFQVTRAFRAAEFGDRHNPEFTMVEWYRVGETYEAIMDDAEELLWALGDAVGIEDAPAVEGMRGPSLLVPPYPRIPFATAFARAGAGDPFPLSPEERDQVLVETVEPTLGRDTPEFLIEYPVDQASLARVKPGDPRVAERFELYSGGLELANGFTELPDADEYLARCQADLRERERLGFPAYPIDRRYVSMLRDGLPPCAGVALGFDRVAMLLLGASTIRDVIAFPFDVA
jgi:lysyl-tRNA synthetase class 2